MVTTHDLSTSDEVSVDTATDEGSHGRRQRVFRVVRWVVAIAYAAYFVRRYQQQGFPFDRERVMLWIAGALLITGIGHGLRRPFQIALDWFPFAVLLVLYDYSRGIADDLGRPVLVGGLVDAEKFLFGGTVPSVWLQGKVLDPNAGTGWWELGSSIIYASHFVVPFALAGWLWWKSRRLWRAWVSRFLTLSFAGVIVYCLAPAAPPWYAAEKGLIAPIERPVLDGWSKTSIFAAPKWFDRGRAVANPVAALPSLHAGYSFLVAYFLFSRLRHPARWLVFLYPISMAFVLVYTAEHYVLDVLAGWGFALGSVFVCGRVGSWWSKRRERKAVAVPT